MLLSYELTIIEDESVALSGSIPTDFTSKSPLFLGTSLMVILIAMVILVVAYMIRLNYYQERLYELTESSGIQLGDYNHKSIKSVKNQIAVAEGNLAETNLGGIVPSM